MGNLYRDDVIKIARGEIGYHEKASNYDLDSPDGNPGTNNYTKYARDLWTADPHFYQGPKQGYAWCCVFVDWCIYDACNRDSVKAQNAKFYTGPYGAGCQFSAEYYKNAGQWYTDPKPGDQIFFGHSGNYQHTGLVEKVENGMVYTIEGNSNNMVQSRCYSVTDGSILGYGRPKYDGDSRPVDLPFVDVPDDAWYHDAVAWGYANGLTAGTDSTHFSPNAPCTRAMLMQMIYKYDLTANVESRNPYHGVK